MRTCLSVVAFAGCILLSGCATSSDNNSSEVYPDAVFVKSAEGGGVDLISDRGECLGKNLYQGADAITEVNGGAYWVITDGKFRLYSIENPSIPVNGDVYSMATKFGNGVSAAGNGDEPIRLIGKDGSTKVVLPDTIVEIKYFQCGLAPFKGKSGKWGYLDTEGKEVISPCYDLAGEFDPITGLALVQTGDGSDASCYHISFDNTKTDAVKSGDWTFSYDDSNNLLIANNNVDLPGIYDNIYPILPNNQFIVSTGDESGVIDFNNNIIIPMSKYASIIALSNGNYLVSAPDWKSEPSEIRAGKGGNPEFIGQFKSNIYDNKGKLVAGPFEKPYSFNADDNSVTFTNLDLAIGGILEQLTPDKVFGFGGNVTAADVAERFGWSVNLDNAVNFLNPPRQKSYYYELKNGEYVEIYMHFTDNILEEVTHNETRGSGWIAYEETVKDGYRFNPGAILESIQVSLVTPDGVTNRTMENYIGNKMKSLGFTSNSDTHSYSISSVNDSHGYDVTFAARPNDILLTVHIPSGNYE